MKYTGWRDSDFNAHGQLHPNHEAMSYFTIASPETAAMPGSTDADRQLHLRKLRANIYSLATQGAKVSKQTFSNTIQPP